MRLLLIHVACFLSLPATAISPAQVIEFWSNGLRYQALSRSGLTVMYARLPLAVRDFAIFQVAISNGSGDVWKVAPTDFFFEAADGRYIRGVAENVVIEDLFRNATEGDVIKLQAAYEKALYGNQHIRSSNGYEERRQYAMAMGPKGLKAAPAAAAITFAASKLEPGASTDGAIFFPRYGKELGSGKVLVRLAEATFEFRLDDPVTDLNR